MAGRISWLSVPWVAVIGNHAELDAEDELGERADHEDRDRDDHQRADQHHVVEEATATQPGEHAGQHADHELEGDRQQGQRDGRRIAVEELGGDPVAEEVGAEVALHQLAHVVAVLHDQRLVEVVLRGERLGVGGRARPLAAAARERVAGREDHGEDQEGGADRHRDHLQQAPDDVLAHRSPLVPVRLEDGPQATAAAPLAPSRVKGAGAGRRPPPRAELRRA